MDICDTVIKTFCVFSTSISLSRYRIVIFPLQYSFVFNSLVFDIYYYTYPAPFPRINNSQSISLKPHLCHKEVTRGQLPARLLHLALALHLEVLQVAAALHHRLHLRLYLTDVEAGHCELLLYRTTDLQGL